MARLAHIQLFPIKSLDPVPVQSVRVLQNGALEMDRRLAIFDADGAVVNGKRDQRLHAIRVEYDLADFAVTLHTAERPSPQRFAWPSQRDQMEQWLSDYLQMPVSLREDTAGGFPDDVEAHGPTVISTATLAAVAEWFSLPVDEVRRRFRANLEIDGVPAFWEDGLVGDQRRTVCFRVGNVLWQAVRICQRCVVPSRDSRTGEPLRGFQQRFAALRQASLPSWSPRKHFDHFYRLAINTRLAARPDDAVLRVGDPVQLV